MPDPPSSPTERLRALLQGPAPVWPAGVDAALERFAASGPRVRVALALGALVLLLLAATGGLLRGPHGPPVPVLVTTTAVPAGAPVTAGDVRVERRPQDLLPRGALAPDALPADGHATGPLPEGGVLAAGQVRSGGPWTAVPDGAAVVPVPLDLLPDLPAGTRLRLVAARADGTSLTVSDAAEVLGGDTTHRWLRVATDDVAGVAGAAATGTLVAGVLP